jgi:hypothetical protein
MKLTYATCQELLKKRDSKKLAGNTYLYKRDNVFCVKFYNTDIITIDSDSTQTLRVDGHFTKTTKDRLNEFSFASLYQERGLWFVRQQENSDKVAFFDGIKFNMFGEILQGETSAPDASDLLAKRKFLDHKIQKYTDGFCKDALENGLGVPDLGDCLICRIYAENPERIKDHDFEHIFSHFEEGYYTRTFVLLMLKSRGYNNINFIWNYHASNIVRGDDASLRGEFRSFFRKYKSKLMQFID